MIWVMAQEKMTSMKNRKKPKKTVATMTTMVVLVTSFREGQVTFFSSARDVLQERPEPFVPSHFVAHVCLSFRSSRVRADGPDPGVDRERWQVRQDSNPQPAVLETAALTN